jgi:hypothetical protein
VIYNSATSSQGAGCAESSGTVTCDLGVLANGAQATIALAVTPIAEGVITNTVDVGGAVFDPQTSNNVATEETLVQVVFVPPSAVLLTGPITGVVDQPVVFTATVDPPAVSLPVTYTWEVDEQGVIVRSGGLDDVLDLAWNTPGEKTITVTLQNVAGSATATRTITIEEEDIILYLPLVLRAATLSPDTMGGVRSVSRSVARSPGKSGPSSCPDPQPPESTWASSNWPLPMRQKKKRRPG